VISGAAGNGVDLQGDGSPEAPAVATVIAGNYIGLDPSGEASIANAGAGIRVGDAEHTVIGGTRTGDANRFSGGSAAVVAGPAAEGLVVRGNSIGVDGAGAKALASPDAGIAIDSNGLASPAQEATVADNEIRMEGGVAIAQQGFGAWIAGNRINGAETGVKAFGPNGGQGNLIEGNSIQGSEVNAIRVENELNEIVGNEIFASGGAGIAIRGSLPFGVSGNLIGGDGAAQENVIVGSGGAAIEITNVKAAMTEVARNRGSANAGLFIDLMPTPPGIAPPNGGIAPPAIAAATVTSAGGTGAKPGALVRVFRKKSAVAGELEAFLGEGTVNPEGGWSVVYASAIPAGTIVAATQTSEEGGTSELAITTSNGDGGSGAGGGAGGGAIGPSDLTPPETAILKGPRGKSPSPMARFRFDSDEAGTTFQCRLDRKPFRSCASPKRYTGLKPGKHTFAVRAIDTAGNADPRPAKRTFTVLAKR
jgi:hypothetical protein